MTDEILAGETREAAELLRDRQPTAASEAMYLEHAPVLRRIAIRKFGISPDDAEALVHDVFINLLVMPRQVKGELRRYLIAAICNASKNYWRAWRAEERTRAAAGRANEQEAAPEDMLVGLSTNMVVATTLARLTPRCREALRRYYLHGEATPDIAAAMNTSPGNVNYLMHMCRKRARAVFEQLMRRASS